MPKDMIEGLFGQLTAAELPVPAQTDVVARGRQRRRRNRVIASVCALAVVAVAGSAIAYVQRAAGQAEQRVPSSASKPGGARHHSEGSSAPAGSSPLLLSLYEPSSDQGSWQLVMTRLGSSAAPVALSGLPTWADAQSVIATNPSGGWVISYATARANSVGAAPERLATVSSEGAIRPFGPAFSRQVRITALAVRPDGSAVAIAITSVGTSSLAGNQAARIELVPLAGHGGAVRTWSLSSDLLTMAESLSWEPSGTQLSYIPGSDETGGGFAADGVVTLNTASSASIGPAETNWPPYRKGGGQCHLYAGAWEVGTSTYVALEQCGNAVVVLPVNPVTGAHEGSAAQLPGGMNTYFGCGDPTLDAAPNGHQVLISGCVGLYLYKGGHVSKVPGPAVGATAWAGTR
jgi:hypothetical protein